MSFDFYTSYSNLSNVELLKITLQRELYQREAVGTAEQILQSRNITEEERITAENDVAEISRSMREKRERQRDRAVQADNFVRNIFMPENKSPSHIIRWFCIACGAIWLYQVITNIGLHVSLVTDISLVSLILLAIEIGQFVMLYWLFKLKSKGWVLLMIYFTLYLISNIYAITTWEPARFQFDFSPDRSTLIIQSVIDVLVLGYFNSPKILITLNIKRRHWFMAAGACIGLAALYYLVLTSVLSPSI